MSDDQCSQIECSICRSVAALQAKADPLQQFIRRVVPRSYGWRAHAGELSRRQLAAIDWSIAISDCLRRAIAPHPRCQVCTVLMGAGHVEVGPGKFCSTHSERLAAAP